MKQTSLLIKSLFSQLFKYPVKQYYSQPHTIQSSVGIIFKFPNIESIQTKEQFDSKIFSDNSAIESAQILFVQRSNYHTDKNAFNVVFPGGQCDPQQSDIQACERQLKQEVGIEVNNQCIHLGQLPKNFYYLKKRGKQVHISCHIYCLKSSSNQWEPKINPDQLRKFKWVKFSELLNPQKYKSKNQIKLGIFQRMPAFAAKIAKQNITHVTMQELDLGMDRNLWGLTLYIWCYMLQMALNNPKNKLQNEEESIAKHLIKSMMTFDLEFRPYSVYKFPVTIVASGWHYLYRVKPFKYNPLQLNARTNLTRNILMLVLFIVIMNLWYAIT